MQNTNASRYNGTPLLTCPNFRERKTPFRTAAPLALSPATTTPDDNVAIAQLKPGNDVKNKAD